MNELHNICSNSWFDIKETDLNFPNIKCKNSQLKKVKKL